MVDPKLILKGEWTLADVEETLTECHELWRRSPGGGKRPFAGDAPWHLMRPEQGDFGGDGVDGASSSRRPRPALDAVEVGVRDQVTGWLHRITDVEDRKIVWLATGTLHREESQVPWKELSGRIGWQRSLTALAFRYRRGLAEIVVALNGWPRRRTSAVASGDLRRREDRGA